MFDASGINAMIIFSLVNPDWKENTKNNRKTFLKELSNSLIEPHLRERAQVTTLRSYLRLSISEILGMDAPQRQHPATDLPRKLRSDKPDCCWDVKKSPRRKFRN
ncbi:unnamed protein product [Acanthoscelides obtectus]|uniref:Uncharacterized protein n=1 Tax=Acanthoscelides obtectus TaxID=200917 RepID=A0A9P0JW23_ACAOB|nr:unnamed protein product [Acanthoscelides obtectus]CAK1671208.1 hypothetical protein AOBTE_LOCUS28145 [Acanthoscelides obtectus]